MDERIYKLYNIVNKAEYKGNCNKYECKIKGEHGIFKERINSASKDHIVESIIYQLALRCGVTCAFAKVRKTKETIGCFSRFEIPENVKFEHASFIYGTQELHVEELFKRTATLAGLNSSFMVRLYQYMVFDFLTGQLDRHLENLAVLKINNKLSWYKLYDNGLALQSHLNNEAAIQQLELGYYTSRVGISKDILEAIVKYKKLIGIDIQRVIKLDWIEFNSICEIIEASDIYKEIIKDRKIAMVNFINRQKEVLKSL